MKRALTVSAALCMIMILRAQEAAIFPADEKSPNIHHVGDVWLTELSPADTTFTYNIAQAVFAPGARLDWHVHPGGQILLITDGVGYYQEKGKMKRTVRKGDVVKCQPGVEHWHGATSQDGVSYIATSPAEKGKTVWLRSVTDQEYGPLANESLANTTSDEEQLMILSKKKWLWMADKKADTLAGLFHDKSMFVHMGGSWGKDQEISVIRSGQIHYKKADIHEVSVNIVGNTAILLNKITLLAVVGGNEVTNPFMVTEGYIKDNGSWKLVSLSFTRLLTPGK